MTIKATNVFLFEEASDSNAQQHQLPQSTTGVLNATVVSMSGRDAIVDLDGSRQTASMAFSCLVAPQPGDVVLMSSNNSGDCFILGIIERKGSQDMTLSFPADASMISEQGSLGLFCKDSVMLVAGDKINCLSDEVTHRSRKATVNYEELTATGMDLQASYKTVRFVSQLFSSIAKQVIAKAKNYVRHTEDSDQIKAGQMSRKIDGLYTVESKFSVLVSKEDTKIDGERIHMG